MELRDAENVPDIVYVLKDAAYDDELKYSLRSVEKNFPCRRVWFYGGSVTGFVPDKQVVVPQNRKRKYDNVRAMLEMIADNDEITDRFYLFNDDFFVLRPMQQAPMLTDGELLQLCSRIEHKNRGVPTAYTAELRKTNAALEEARLSTHSFELHVPILMDRSILKKVLEMFPDNRGTRSLYGNYLLSLPDGEHTLRGFSVDCKIFDPFSLPPEGAAFCSTEDTTFNSGAVGRYIRELFPKKSRWEK